MKKLFRRWARWFFNHWIRVYQIQVFIPSTELLYEKPEHLKYWKFEMVRMMAEKMYEEGLIEFEQEKDIKTQGFFIRARVRAI